VAASPGGAWSPRIDLVFRFWQCDKENHGWREGLPLTVSAKFRSRGPGLHPPVKSAPNEKRILPLPVRRHPTHRIGRYKTTIRPKRPLADASASETRTSKSTARADDLTGLTGTTGHDALIGMFPALPITTVSSRFPNA
jgi:hypothetical protein